MTRIELDFNDVKIKYNLDKYKQLTQEQMKVIRAYDLKQKSKGNSPNTRENHMFLLMQFARTVKKPFDAVTEEDITKFLAKDIKQTTRNWYISVLKIFFKWYKRPELVEDLKQKPCDMPIVAKDLWTEKEIKQLIEVAHHPRDKCAVAMMFDLSIERKCIYQMNIEDIEINGSGVYITVHGKHRGYIEKRRIQCINSAPYVIQWLNCHPQKENKQAPFFVSFSNRTYGKRISYNYIYELLNNLADKAGINKPIRPHLIRHSKLTDLYRKGFTGIALQKYAGWTSPLMEQRYVNLSNNEMDAEVDTIKRMVEHYKKYKGALIPYYLCPECDFKTASKSEIIKHLGEH